MPKYLKTSQSEWKIAQKLYFSEEGQKRTSRPAVRVALGGIVIGVMVMIVAICVVVGFKEEVQQKVAGFGSHIQVVNFDNNATYELQPVDLSDSLLQKLQGLAHVKKVSTFASKPGILKTDSAFQGIIFKGTDYWDYFADNLVIGSLPTAANEVIISSILASQLHLTVGDQILCYFVQENLRVRRLYVSGLYNTCMSEMDRMFVLGDIALVRQLNQWKDSQASGIEILVDDLSCLHDIS